MSAVNRKWLQRLWCVLVLQAMVPAAQTEPAVSRSGYFRVSFTSELDPIEINRIHRWVIHVTDADGTPVTGAAMTLAGGMPLHDHGLPTSPRMTRELGNGDYLVEGLRFHMRGDWEVVVTVAAGDLRDTALLAFSI